MTTIAFNNYSRFSRRRQDNDIYSWCVYVKGDTKLMNSIEMIEYTLHPTFPNPVREIVDREHCFALQSEGWGTFKIEIRTFFVDGREVDSNYLLRLEADDWPKGPIFQTNNDPNAALVYATILDSSLDWRKESTLLKWANITPSDALDALQRLSAGGYIRKAYFRSIDGENLWGATSRVGKLPTADAR